MLSGVCLLVHVLVIRFSACASDDAHAHSSSLHCWRAYSVVSRYSTRLDFQSGHFEFIEPSCDRVASITSVLHTRRKRRCGAAGRCSAAGGWLLAACKCRGPCSHQHCRPSMSSSHALCSCHRPAVNRPPFSVGTGRGETAGAHILIWFKHV